MALMMLDFPALRLPKMPICVRSAEGVVFRLIGFSPFFIDKDMGGKPPCLYLCIEFLKKYENS